MKAIVVREFGTPQVMKLEEVAEPTAGPTQVLVRVKAIGVNPVDTYIRSGSYARIKPTMPYTPGMDLGGVIEGVGDGVTAFAPGDRVYAHGTAPGHGACAELTVCDGAQVHRLPDSVSFQQGAALGIPYGSAWRGLFNRARARAGDIVLVHGASGGVGTAAIQVARLHGLQVIGTAGSGKGLELVRQLGAHHVLNHGDPDYMQQALALTGGRGVDVVLEMLANVNLDKDLDVLAPGGRVVVIGCRGRIEIDPRKTMGRDASIMGMLMFNATPGELKEIHAGLVAGLEAGALRPVIGQEFPLADAPRAHEAVMAAGAYGKIVIVP